MKKLNKKTARIWNIRTVRQVPTSTGLVCFFIIAQFSFRIKR
nr:MAG TPA: hypothetical protein [Caudoviricetes sp.]